MSSYAEFLVGISLLIVGFLAIRTSLKVNIHMHQHMHGDETTHKHFHFHAPGNKLHRSHTHAATGLGVLHGFAETKIVIWRDGRVRNSFLKEFCLFRTYLPGTTRRVN